MNTETGELYIGQLKDIVKEIKSNEKIKSITQKQYDKYKDMKPEDRVSDYAKEMKDEAENATAAKALGEYLKTHIHVRTMELNRIKRAFMTGWIARKEVMETEKEQTHAKASNKTIHEEKTSQESTA